MERFMMEKLKNWKAKKYRTPIILEGAPQVGKTWLVQEFGKNEYDNNMLYINLKKYDNRIKKLFGKRHNAEQLFLGLELIFGKKIEKSDTLIIFDEIQKMPEILENIGCLYNEFPECHVICISSQIDIVLRAKEQFQSVKVEVLKLYPMSFQEFFLAVRKEEGFKKIFDTSDFDMMDVFKDDYNKVLKQYYFVGGMPEAVLCFVENGNLESVRKVHKNILELYGHFFSQYAPKALYLKIKKIWQCIPIQFEQENKKFEYGTMNKGDRAKFYEDAIAWLSMYGFVHKVNRITNPELILDRSENMKVYKLFLMDIGILSCMFGLQPCEFLDDKLFVEFGGALTEQYILQQMKWFSGWNVNYYTNERSACEINFLIDNKSIVVPVDISMETNSKSKRLSTYLDKFHPEKSVQISMADYSKEKQVLYLPLYAAEKMIAALDI